MFDNIRVFASLIAIVALGIGGSLSAQAQERYDDPWEPDPYEEEELDVDVDVDVEVDEEEPEFVPPVIPIAPEAIAGPTSVNPLVSGETGRLAIDLGMHLSETGDDLTFFLLSPVLQARIPIGDLAFRGSGFEIGADVGFLMVNPLSDPNDQLQNAVAVGNPFLSGHYVLATEALNFRLGAGIAIPLAGVSGDRGVSRAFGYENAIANRAGFDRWLWEPDRLGLVVPARVEGLVGRVLLGADGAVGALLWTGAGTQDTTYFGQLAGEVGYQISNRSTLGLRFLGHWLPDVDVDDPSFAFALEPGFRTQLGNAGFLGLRLTLPVDEPYGFAFEEGGNWGLSVTFGTQL
jgi:hypothetical protein